MEEVIAVKQNKWLGIFIAFSLVCAALAALLIFLYIDEHSVIYIVAAAVFAVLLVVILALTVKLLRQPKVILVYRDGKLHFPDFSCRPRELVRAEVVYYKVASDFSGTLRVAADGKDKRVHMYLFIKEPKKVKACLDELIANDKTKGKKGTKAKGDKNG